MSSMSYLLKTIIKQSKEKENMKTLCKRMIVVMLIFAMCLSAGCSKNSENEATSTDSATSGNAQASTSDSEQADSDAVKRTIMLYPVGSNLETEHAQLSRNLKVAFEAGIPDSVNFIVATLGSNRWHLESDYIYDADGNHIEIDPAKKQLWKLTGKMDEGNARMTLLGELSFEGTVLKEECLTEFIDYCKDSFPADKYDLIIWDHGYGPMGFGEDFADSADFDIPKMSVAAMANAIENSKMDEPFEFIHFDACLMSNVEVIMTLADKAENFVVSSALEPGDGGNYEWLSAIPGHEDMSGYEIGKYITDYFVDYYNTKGGSDFKEATMAVINTEKFMKSVISPMTELMSLVAEEGVSTSGDAEISFYDELLSSSKSILYSSDYSLFDLKLFAESLGISQTEMNSNGSDNKFQYGNKYTETVQALKSAFQDDTMMYQRSSDDIQKTVTYASHRDEDGSIVKDEKLVPGGINIFFPNGKTTATCDYIKAIDGMVDYIGANGIYDPEARIKLLKLFEEAACEYAIIRSTGKIVTNLSQDGKESIEAEDIMDSWKADDPAIIKSYETQGYDLDSMPEKTQWDQSINLIYDKLNEYLELRGVSTNDWINQLAAQQSKEVVLTSNIEAGDSESEKTVTIHGTSPRILDYFEPVTESIMIKTAEGEDLGLLGSLSGSLSGDNPYAEKEAKLSIDKITDSWYEFIDGDGKGHIMAFERDELNPNLYYIPIHLETPPDESGYGQDVNGLLHVKADNDNYEILGFQVSYENDLSPLDEETYPDAKISLCVRSGSLDYNKIMEDSTFTLKDMDKWKIQKDVPLSEIDDLTDDVKESFTQKYSVKDIYGVVHDLP